MTTGDMSLRAKWRRFSRKVAATGRETGPRAAVGLAARWSAAFARKQAYGVAARIRDARTGLSTAADFPETEFPDNATHGDAVHYMPVPATVFDGVMKDLTGISPERYTFIDLGCGKGAALLLALDHGFGRVIGVELNDRLVPVAEENLAAYARRRGTDPDRGTVVEGDVVGFRFPPEPLVVFLFNPFGADTLTAVLANLEASVADRPRDVVVAYASPVHADRIDDSEVFRRLPSRSPRWAVWRATPGGVAASDR